MAANLLIGFLNLAALAIVLLVGEYELAKWQKPWASWLQTPTAFDVALVSLIGLLSVINLAVLAFVMFRYLDHHRRWLWWMTALAASLVIVLTLALGPHFLPILWPRLRS